MPYINSGREKLLPDAPLGAPLAFVPVTPHIDPPELPIPPWTRPVDARYSSDVDDLPLSRLLGDSGPVPAASDHEATHVATIGFRSTARPAPAGA